MHHHIKVIMGNAIAVPPPLSSAALRDLEMAKNAVGPAAPPASELLRNVHQMDQFFRLLDLHCRDLRRQ